MIRNCHGNFNGKDFGRCIDWPRLAAQSLFIGNLRPRPHVSGDFCVRQFFMRIHLASTRVRRIRSVYPEISVYALQSGNFCIRCVSGYVWTLVSVHFCIR